MATVRGSARVAEENDPAVRESKVAKVGQSQPAGTKRKALGEISNIQSGVVTRSQANKDKQGPQKPAELKDPTAAARARVATRKAAADKAAAAQPGQRASALQARAKPARQPRQDAASLTSVLQARSEQAVTQTKPAQPAAAPSSPLPDIDSLDRKDPLAVTEYVNDIFDYYRRAEPKYRVSPTYMESQKEINQKMRAILVDWLVEVHAKFKLVPETLFLTVNVIDRFLEAKEVTRKNLQLVGVTAMLIGSKYEEIWAPEVRDFIYISDKAYNKEQILGMEKLMLNTLKFELSLPTPFNFLLRFLKACGARQDRQVEWLSYYLAELALVDYGMLKYSYSLTSAAAICVAMKTLNRIEPYPKALARHSRYSEDAVKPCAMALVELMQKAPSATLTAVYKKYSNQKYGEVAKLDPPMWLLEESMETSSA